MPTFKQFLKESDSVSDWLFHVAMADNQLATRPTSEFDEDELLIDNGRLQLTASAFEKVEQNGVSILVSGHDEKFDPNIVLGFSDLYVVMTSWDGFAPGSIEKIRCHYVMFNHCSQIPVDEVIAYSKHTNVTIASSCSINGSFYDLVQAPNIIFRRSHQFATDLDKALDIFKDLQGFTADKVDPFELQARLIEAGLDHLA